MIFKLEKILVKLAVSEKYEILVRTPSLLLFFRTIS